jgi:hypothetical protein
MDKKESIPALKGKAVRAEKLQLIELIYCKARPADHFAEQAGMTVREI